MHSLQNKKMSGLWRLKGVEGCVNWENQPKPSQAETCGHANVSAPNDTVPRRMSRQRWLGTEACAGLGKQESFLQMIAFHVGWRIRLKTSFVFCFLLLPDLLRDMPQNRTTMTKTSAAGRGEEHLRSPIFHSFAICKARRFHLLCEVEYKHYIMLYVLHCFPPNHWSHAPSNTEQSTWSTCSGVSSSIHQVPLCCESSLGCGDLILMSQVKSI